VRESNKMEMEHKEKIGIEEGKIPLITTTSRLVEMLREFNKENFPRVDIIVYPDNTVLARTPEPMPNLESVYVLFKAGKGGIKSTHYSGRKSDEYVNGFNFRATEGRL
jgi:hypothetical protein